MSGQHILGYGLFALLCVAGIALLVRHYLLRRRRLRHWYGRRD